eukprot:5821425-Prymnesium_polylepis.1
MRACELGSCASASSVSTDLGRPETEPAPDRAPPACDPATRQTNKPGIRFQPSSCRISVSLVRAPPIRPLLCSAA